MLKDRILFTLRFFDLQDTPLTLFELHKFLLAGQEELKNNLDEQREAKDLPDNQAASAVSAGEILTCLETECAGETESRDGFYALCGRTHLVSQRLENYQYGIKREKFIRRFISGMRHVPFVRGVGLVGSQPLGLQKKDSDIDLLILVETDFLWLARFFVTAYFQLLGRRRHGKKIADRFCLNHYVAEGKYLTFDRNLYTAAEYLKMRPLVYADKLQKFLGANCRWIKPLFPHAVFSPPKNNKPSFVQNLAERLLKSKLGLWLERQSRNLQKRRLNIGEFIIASDDELSFHPNNRKKQLFQKFFETKTSEIDESYAKV